MSKLEAAYEELRAIIDGGSESYTHADAVEHLKFVMAQPKQLTDEMVLAAARALNDRQAEACGVDKVDQWKFYSEEFKEDAHVMLKAAHGIKE